MNNNKIIAETERLILRKYNNDDLQDLYEYLSSSMVVQYEPYKIMTMDEVKNIRVSYFKPRICSCRIKTKS